MKLLIFAGMCCIGASALAGRYVATYEHAPCKAESMSPTGVYSSRPYTETGGVCKGHASASDPLGSGSSTVIGGWAKCSGQITATATWDNEGDLSSEPPKSVLITETASATWIGATGLCDNGLGDPEINGTSQGVHYSIKNNPGASFKLYCSPTAFATSGVVDVSYSVTVGPIKIIVGGALEHGGNTKTLTGTSCSAEVIVEGDPQQAAVTFRNHNWTIDGDIFKQFLVTYGHETGTVIPIGASDLTATVPSWIWNDKRANANISCSFEAFVGEDSIGSGQASRKVEVLRPGYEIIVTLGEVTYTGSSVKAGDGFTAGIEFDSTAVITEPFNNMRDAGEFMFGQLAYLDRYTYCMPVDLFTVFHYRVYTGGYVLDNSWGYEPEQPALTGPVVSDSPSWTLPYPALSYYVNDAFKMYLMHRGAGGDWVPLAFVHWRWKANGSRSGHFFSWPDPIDGSIEKGMVIDTTLHPQWTSKYDNSIPPPIPGP